MPSWSYSLGDEGFRILPEIFYIFFQLSNCFLSVFRLSSFNFLNCMIGLFHNHFGCLLAAVSQGLYYDVDAFLKTALLSAAY